MTIEIRDLWQRLEAWATANAPCMLEDLNPGASEEEIAALELELGRELPEDFRASLRIHNGESSGWPCTVFGDFGDYLSISQVLSYRQLYQEVAAQLAQDEDQWKPEQLIEQGMIFVEGPVIPVMFSPHWIPFLDFNGDIFWALDFEPAGGGHEGQVIEVDWEGGSWKVVAPSFTKFLADYVESLESGAYRLVDGRLTRHEP